MSIFRTEINVSTGEVVVINQTAYKNGEEIIVLDDGVEPPQGFVIVDLEAENGRAD